MKKTIALAIGIYALLAAVCNAAPTLSVETLGAIRSVNIHDGEEYGAGVDVGVKFNKYVTGHARLIAYETDNWRGSAIDEASLLVEATLLTSANGRISLSAVGGGDYDIAREDFGFSVGPRVTVGLIKHVALVAESRIRAWMDGGKDLISTAGIQFSF